MTPRTPGGQVEKAAEVSYMQKLVADQALDLQMVKEVLEKKVIDCESYRRDVEEGGWPTHGAPALPFPPGLLREPARLAIDSLECLAYDFG